MISRSHRFHGHNSLNYVYRNGEIVRGPQFSTKYVINKRRQTYRLAVVVSKKVSKSAVKRNRIRRRIYEQVRLVENQIQQPYDIVITIFSDQLLNMPITEITDELRSQLLQSHILDSTPTPVHDTIMSEGE